MLSSMFNGQRTLEYSRFFVKGKLAFGVNFSHFVSNNINAFAYGLFIPGVGDSQAFMAMFPLVFHSGEEVVPGYHEYTSFFQTLIKLKTGYR